jgi:hypothetical protein
VRLKIDFSIKKKGSAKPQRSFFAAWPSEGTTALVKGDPTIVSEMKERLEHPQEGVRQASAELLRSVAREGDPAAVISSCSLTAVP